MTVDVDLVRKTLKEKEWAQLVYLHIDEYPDIEDSDIKSTWSSYYASNQKEVVPSIIGIFLLFKESWSDPRMILHTIELLKKAINHINSNQVPIATGDQPIYAIMKKLQ